MNKLYQLSQNQKTKHQLNKKLQQNKNFPIEIAFGKAEMKLKVVTKLINTIEFNLMINFCSYKMKF
jgi:hypothetical protein